MVCLGLEPGAAGWKAQTNPLSYGGTPTLGKYLASKPVKPIFKQVLGDGEKFVNVASIVVHPSYNTTFQDNDFALLKLSRDQCHKLLILTDTTARLLCPHVPRQFLEKWIFRFGDIIKLGRPSWTIFLLISINHDNWSNPASKWFVNLNLQHFRTKR